MLAFVRQMIATYHRFVFRKKVTLSDSSAFYRSSKVINMQHNRKNIVVGSHTHIKGELLIYKHGGEIRIGDYCFLGEGSRIWSSHMVSIGDRVLIAHNVNIHDNNSHPTDPALRHSHFVDIITNGHPNNIDLNEKPVTIGNDAWIGFNSVILKGVTIGSGAIVAANSVVTHDVDPYTVVGGVPACLIKKLSK